MGRIAACRPERVVGMHFFNPVHKMPLVEVIAAEGSALYTATRTTSQRGEVTLVLTSVRKGPGGKGHVAHGTYRAKLVPVGAGKSGEVVIDVTF